VSARANKQSILLSLRRPLRLVNGLGVLQDGGQGFRLHGALAVGFDGVVGVPLGLVAEVMVVRPTERSLQRGAEKY
jgi:hypothetical protein